jgi:hypothetical protein
MPAWLGYTSEGVHFNFICPAVFDCHLLTPISYGMETDEGIPFYLMPAWHALPLLFFVEPFSTLKT